MALGLGFNNLFNEVPPAPVSATVPIPQGAIVTPYGYYYQGQGYGPDGLLLNAQPGATGGTIQSNVGVGGFSGPTLYQMVLGVIVLTAITFALPRRFAVWLPPIVLLSYVALHQQSVTGLLNSLANGIKAVGNFGQSPTGGT